MADRKENLAEVMQTLDILRRRMFSRDADAKIRISPTQWLAMRVIAHQPNCTVKTIAEKMQVTSSAATQLVKKLVQKKYVQRRENPKDRRQVTIALANKMAEEVVHLRKQALTRTLKVFDQLNDTELKQLTALLRKIALSPKKTA